MQKLTDPDTHIQPILDRARRGDRQAFDELVCRSRDRLRGSVERWIRFRVGPSVDVEDVLQETFFRAFRSIDRFECHSVDGDERFIRWLCGIAKKALADLLRRMPREAGAASVEGAASGPSKMQALRREERFDRFQKAFDRLPPDYRQALVLSRLEGLPAKEVADRMGRTPASVYHLIVRALKLLREEFGDTESLHLPGRPLRREGGRDER